MLGNIIVDVVACRHRNDLALEGIVSLLDPLRASLLAVLFQQRLELGGRTGLLGNCNYVARLNLVRRNVNALAVYGEVCMVNQLTSSARAAALLSLAGRERDAQTRRAATSPC